MRKDETLDQLLNLALPRLENLWQRANEVPEEQESLMWESIDQLSKAFEEIYVVMEELHLRVDQLETTNLSLVAERQQYQDLFEFAPGGYLVTDLNAVILEANQTAASLLNIPQMSYLVNKPLVGFVAEEERRDFRKQIAQLQTMTVWQVQLQPRQGKSFAAACTVSVVRDEAGEATALRWLLQDITELYLNNG